MFTGKKHVEKSEAQSEELSLVALTSGSGHHTEVFCPFSPVLMVLESSCLRRIDRTLQVVVAGFG